MNATTPALPKAPRASEHILPRIAGRDVFGIQLRRLREVGGLTRAELSRQAHVPYSRLGAWEYGVFLPTRSMRTEVESLDRLVSGGGKLTALWLESAPARESLAAKIYRLPQSSWPRRLCDQWQNLVAYRTTNPQELPRDGDARWSETTISAFLWFIKAFMGFLVNEMKLPRAELSLLFLCDWKLMKRFLEFKRQRSGRDHYTHSDEMLVRHYRSVLKTFMPFLWKEADQDAYWKDNLPANAVMEFEVVPGVKRKQEIALAGTEEKWAALVAEAARASERFSRSEVFVKGAFSKLAQSFIDSKSALSQVGDVLAAQIEEIPEQITDRDVAIHCRGLATAALLAARAFRKGTVERLTTEHVRIMNGKVHLDIPPSIVKNRRPIQGPLPEVPWLHRVLVIYTEKARPLLLRGEDEGYWFTTYGANGGRASHNVLYNDIRRILGVNPHAMRYVLATDGKRRNLSDEDIAEVLCHTPEMTRHIYQKIDAEDRNCRANHTISKIMAPEPSTGTNGNR